jgi:hypothetical protein
MIVRLLACVVAQALGMGILHVVLGRGEGRRFVTFSAASGAFAMLVGLVAIGPSLIEHYRMSASTIAWIPAFGLGFFAAGSVLGAAWMLLVHGADIWIRRGLARSRR